MMSIKEHCQKFETKVLEKQEKKGKNSRMLIKEQFDETVKRLKMLKYVGEQRNLSDFNLMRVFALLRVPNVYVNLHCYSQLPDVNISCFLTNDNYIRHQVSHINLRWNLLDGQVQFGCLKLSEGQEQSLLQTVDDQ